MVSKEVGESAFRASSFLELSELPMPTPLGVEDLSRRGRLALTVTQWDPNPRAVHDDRGRFGEGFGVVTLLGTVAAAAVTGKPTALLVGLPLTVLFFLLAKGMRDSGGTRTRISVRGSALHYLHAGWIRSKIPASAIKAVLVERVADGSARVIVEHAGPARAVIASTLPEETAHWIARRVRAALR